MANEFLEAALDYAARGWAIFPCGADKRPLTENGVLDATTDPAQVAEWWTKWPRANPALNVGAANFMVLDYDPDCDINGLVAKCGAIPETKLVQNTPRGGRHEFYLLREGETVAPSASRLADHIDVRSFHSYVLLAPSRTADGTYTWESQGTPAFRTDEMVRQANIAKQRSATHDTWLIEPDMPENIELAITWLKERAQLAVEGKGGDLTTYRTAAMMKSYALSPGVGFELMWEHWWPRCTDKWFSEDAVQWLESKIAHAYEYNTSDPGNMTPAYRTAKSKSLFQRVEKPLPDGKRSVYGRYRFVDREGMDHIPPPKWLISNFLTADGFAMLYGPPGSAKTFVALDIALSVATGFPNEGNWHTGDTGPVLFCAGEGRTGIKKRVKAWEDLHWGGEKTPFVLVDPVPTVNESAEGFAFFIEGCKALSPIGYKLIVIDTVSRALQGENENESKTATAFTRMVQAMQQEFDCCVLVLHHSGKDGGAERGSSAFRGDIDTLVRIDRKPKAMVFDLHMEKLKEGSEWEKPKKLRLKHVDVVGDKLGTLVVMPYATDQTGPADEVSRDPEPSTKAQKGDDFRDKINASLIDDAVYAVLSGNHTKQWTTKDMAQAVAHRDEIDIKSGTLQNHNLKDIRETKGTKSHRCYDPSAKVYRFRALK